MAATLKDMYNTLYHQELTARTKAAVLFTSNYALAESGATPNHAERLAMAKKCLTNEDYLNAQTKLAMFSMATNDTIASDPDAATDTDIKWVVDTAYTNMALNNPPA